MYRMKPAMVFSLAALVMAKNDTMDNMSEDEMDNMSEHKMDNKSGNGHNMGNMSGNGHNMDNMSEHMNMTDYASARCMAAIMAIEMDPMCNNTDIAEICKGDCSMLYEIAMKSCENETDAFPPGHMFAGVMITEVTTTYNGWCQSECGGTKLPLVKTKCDFEGGGDVCDCPDFAMSMNTSVCRSLKVPLFEDVVDEDDYSMEMGSIGTFADWFDKDAMKIMTMTEFMCSNPECLAAMAGLSQGGVCGLGGNDQMQKMCSQECDDVIMSMTSDGCAPLVDMMREDTMEQNSNASMENDMMSGLKGMQAMCADPCLMNMMMMTQDPSCEQEICVMGTECHGRVGQMSREECSDVVLPGSDDFTYGQYAAHIETQCGGDATEPICNNINTVTIPMMQAKQINARFCKKEQAEMAEDMSMGSDMEDREAGGH